MPELTTHTITLPTPEQRAVFAACSERFHGILGHDWSETTLQVVVQDGSHHHRFLSIAMDGTTRESKEGLVPTALYGALPKCEDARREWGKGFPAYALKYLPTPSPNKA